jgi:hypothetical protein
MEIKILDDRWEIMFPKTKQQKNTRNMTDEATKNLWLGFL